MSTNAHHYGWSARCRRLLLPLILVGPIASAQTGGDCDSACLTGLADDYLEALLAFDGMALPGMIASLPWAESVGFTENDVGLMIGDGLWGSSTAVGEGYTLADPATGNVLWFGIVEEHGQPAYAALRLGVTGGRIAEVETVVGREGSPAPFAPTAGYALDPAFSATVPPADRLPRRRLEALVRGYYDSLAQNDGTLHTAISDLCRRLTNGVATSHPEGAKLRGCRQQLAAGWYRYVDGVRALRMPIVDESRGVVVAIALLDHAARFVDYETLDGEFQKIPIEYPNTHAVLEIFKIEDGEIRSIEGVTAFQPYLMPTRWRTP
jgi:hypothetical protein